uniref:JmjC domain-containing protein n=1 Tax=Parastrongyloides trichosuri TaxID=131310 RepID=A0A0N4ZL74_PARTI
MCFGEITKMMKEVKVKMEDPYQWETLPMEAKKALNIRLEPRKNNAMKKQVISKKRPSKDGDARLRQPSTVNKKDRVIERSLKKISTSKKKKGDQNTGKDRHTPKQAASTAKGRDKKNNKKSNVGLADDDHKKEALTEEFLSSCIIDVPDALDKKLTSVELCSQINSDVRFPPYADLNGILKNAHMKFGDNLDKGTMLEIISICQNYAKFPEDYFNKNETLILGTESCVPKYQDNVEWHPLRSVAYFKSNSLNILKYPQNFITKSLYKKYIVNGDNSEEDFKNGFKNIFVNLSQAIYKAGYKGIETYISPEIFQKYNMDKLILLPHQQELFNITDEDILGICPGIAGPFQRMYISQNNLYYHVFLIALYKRFSFPENIRKPESVLEEGELRDELIKNPNFYQKMPSNYVFSTPKFINFHCVIKHELLNNNQLQKAAIDMFCYFIH